jgi:hypothetical protein
LRHSLFDDGEALSKFDFCPVAVFGPSIELLQLHCRNISTFQCINELFTKLAPSSGPENIGSGRPLSGLPAQGSVLSPSCITPENNGKIRPQPDRENALARPSGGEGVRHIYIQGNLMLFFIIIYPIEIMYKKAPLV